MKPFIAFASAVAILFAVACQTKKEKPESSVTATAEERVEEPKPFQYATLPDQSEWTVKLTTSLQVVRQEIQSTGMPEPVWTTFPIPETTYSAGENGATRMHMPHQSGSMTGSYGMDTGGCIPEALQLQVKQYGGVGVAGGQYGWYQRVRHIADGLLYDPRQWGFLIYYSGSYLDITFPDLQTMHVRKLTAPDISKVANCGKGQDPLCRFEPSRPGCDSSRRGSD